MNLMKAQSMTSNNNHNQTDKNLKNSLIVVKLNQIALNGSDGSSQQN